MPSIITLISNSRTELMGIAIFSVLIGHIWRIADIPVAWQKELLLVPLRWLFTEGFLFLSGFSIYFSLLKDNSLLSFYRKRVRRLYIPFLLIAGPFLTLITLHHGDSWCLLLARLTAINFWIEGNYCSMWYISITLTLYFVAPIFWWITNREKGLIYWFLLFISYTLFIEYLRFLPEESYYRWITQTPAFLIGMLFAKLRNMKGSIINAYVLCAILLLPFLKVVLIAYWRFLFIPKILQQISYLFIFSFLLYFFKESTLSIGKMGLKVLQFLGVHSLEIYILHMLFYETFRTFLTIPSTTNILISIFLSLLICKPANLFVQKVTKAI